MFQYFIKRALKSITGRAFYWVLLILNQNINFHAQNTLQVLMYPIFDKPEIKISSYTKSAVLHPILTNSF